MFIVCNGTRFHNSVHRISLAQHALSNRDKNLLIFLVFTYV